MIHGQVPLPVPCYDFTLITDLTFTSRFARENPRPKIPRGLEFSCATHKASGTASFPGVTGGEYKT